MTEPSQWNYSRLKEWGDQHLTVNHGRGEYARDGFHEVHVNTREGYWSLWRSWLRPHRGLSQEKLPLYVSFFQVVHNARKRGKALLESLVAIPIAPPPRTAGWATRNCVSASSQNEIGSKQPESTPDCSELE